jgi:hypothetical protein
MSLEPQREIIAKNIKQEMHRIERRLLFIYGDLQANREVIFRFQLLAVYVLLVHNCGECRISPAVLLLVTSYDFVKIIFWLCEWHFVNRAENVVDERLINSQSTKVQSTLPQWYYCNVWKVYKTPVKT